MPAVRWRLDRYILAELTGPLALGLLIYSFILLIQHFFRLAELIIRRGLPASTVGELLLYYMPSVLVLTLPMSLLLAVLLGVGRLASDSELIAMRASGCSLYRILRPVLLLGLLFGSVNTYLMLELLPRGNSAYSRLILDIATRTLGTQFEPRIFYNEFPGKILYVFDMDPRGREWRGVLVADSVTTSDRPSDLIVAERGRLEVSPDGEQVALRLENAVQHTFELSRPDRYETRRYERMRTVLRDRFVTDERARAFGRKHARAMTYAEARDRSTDPEVTPRERADALVQIQKMFAIPAACPVFALLALPLAFTNRRGGKSSGFAFSIGIVVFYYILLSQGEEAALAGRLPAWLAIWLPNLLLGGIGFALLVARNRDRALLPRAVARRLEPSAARLRALLPRLLRGLGIRERSGPRAVTAARPGSRTTRQIVVRLPRFRIRFPNLLDRYVLRSFVLVLLLVLASGVALLVITDFTEKIDDILARHPPAGLLWRYYKYLSLQLAYDIAPIAVLVTTLVTFSLMSRANEVTACRALGVSLYRLSLPAVVGALAVAGTFALLQARVLPASNQKVAEARAAIKGQPAPRFARSADRQWQKGPGRFMYNFLHFDAQRTTLQRLQVLEFDEGFGLSGRLYAEEGRHSPEGWILGQGLDPHASTGREQLDFQRPFTGEVAVDLRAAPAFFAEEPRRPVQMSFRELAEYAEELRTSPADRSRNTKSRSTTRSPSPWARS
jgi:LPS export ABC transporter permease LptF